jgi:cytochrome bd-type quinol oxidase subunit 2
MRGVAANAWMQAPVGFEHTGLRLVAADPLATSRSHRHVGPVRRRPAQGSAAQRDRRRHGHAVYLANETADALHEDFRRRALAAGTAVVAISVLLLPLLRLEAEHLWQGLTGRALPILVAGASAALASGWTLLRRRYRLARIAAVVQICFLLVGWAVAQYPYLIYPDLTLEAAAAPRSTQWFVLYTAPFGLAVLIPSLWYLFRVFKGKVV